MNSKTLEHIENFANGIKWDVSIKNGQISIDTFLPEVKHLNDKKKIELLERLNSFFMDYLESIRVLEEFKGQLICDETCQRVRSFINNTQMLNISKGKSSIRSTIMQILIGDECAERNEDSYNLIRYIIFKYRYQPIDI